jgi:predicted transcriptional regulator
MSANAPPLLISLKPNYADLVFGGLKTAELRRRISTFIENRDVFVYVSSPVMTLRGGFRVGQVWSGSPQEIWHTVSNLAGVSREVFDDYYEGQNVAFALEIIDVWEFANPLPLEELRKRFPDFVVPQSYRYLKPNECRSFRNLKRRTESSPLENFA